MPITLKTRGHFRPVVILMIFAVASEMTTATAWAGPVLPGQQNQQQTQSNPQTNQNTVNNMNAVYGYNNAGSAVETVSPYAKLILGAGGTYGPHLNGVKQHVKVEGKYDEEARKVYVDVEYYETTASNGTPNYQPNGTQAIFYLAKITPQQASSSNFNFSAPNIQWSALTAVKVFEKDGSFKGKYRVQTQLTAAQLGNYAMNASIQRSGMPSLTAAIGKVEFKAPAPGPRIGYPTAGTDFTVAAKGTVTFDVDAKVFGGGSVVSAQIFINGYPDPNILGAVKIIKKSNGIFQMTFKDPEYLKQMDSFGNLLDQRYVYGLSIKDNMGRTAVTNFQMTVKAPVTPPPPGPTVIMPFPGAADYTVIPGVPSDIFVKVPHAGKNVYYNVSIAGDPASPNKGANPFNGTVQTPSIVTQEQTAGHTLKVSFAPPPGTAAGIYKFIMTLVTNGGAVTRVPIEIKIPAQISMLPLWMNPVDAWVQPEIDKLHEFRIKLSGIDQKPSSLDIFKITGISNYTLQLQQSGPNGRKDWYLHVKYYPTATQALSGSPQMINIEMTHKGVRQVIGYSANVKFKNPPTPPQLIFPQSSSGYKQLVIGGSFVTQGPTLTNQMISTISSASLNHSNQLVAGLSISAINGVSGAVLPVSALGVSLRMEIVKLPASVTSPNNAPNDIFSNPKYWTNAQTFHGSPYTTPGTFLVKSAALQKGGIYAVRLVGSAGGNTLSLPMTTFRVL